MKTYKAIDKIGQAIIADCLCEAIVLKGSIGRGDDDEYSDVDMYAIVTEENYQLFMERREKYLKSYRDIVFLAENDFGVKQMLAIYDDALHVDLYTTTMENLDHGNPVKVYYDPMNLFDNYQVINKMFTNEELISIFDESLYYFVEAASAYARKNYPWTAHILAGAIANCAVLMRNRYDNAGAKGVSVAPLAYKNGKEEGKVAPRIAITPLEDGTWFCPLCGEKNNGNSCRGCEFTR